MPKRYKLTDYKQEKREAGGIEIEADDGRVFKIDPPELWPDEVLELINVESPDVIAVARLLLDDYEAFKAAGGSAVIVATLAREELGGSVPE